VIGLITSVPAHWLPQMQRTGLPKRATIDRINALVFAESMPTTVRVDRDTCWRCGVRGDIGCAHRIAPWGVAA
jgi:phospholipase C